MGSGHSRMTPRAVAAATSGNVLEWYDFTVYGFLAPTLYDFTVYGFLAPTLGRIFFPSDDHVASLLSAFLSAFAVLAVGYAARPIGSVIYGHIGDRFGRKPALLSSVTLMGVGSLLIGFLPTYAEIGVTAAVLLIVIRVVQGISVAGEYMASGVLIVEEARDRSRGFVGSWIACAMMLGCVLGSGVPALITSFLTDSQISAWGWRIPFFFGGAVALFGAVLRLHLSESTALSGTAERSKSPIRMAVREYWPSILRMIALLIPTAIIYFMIFVYAASYLTGRMHFSTAQALDISTINLVARHRRSRARGRLLFGSLRSSRRPAVRSDRNLDRCLAHVAPDAPGRACARVPGPVGVCRVQCDRLGAVDHGPVGDGADAGALRSCRRWCRRGCAAAPWR
jgi:MHS family proline/betaine transporter-like MFS transporter